MMTRHFYKLFILLAFFGACRKKEDVRAYTAKPEKELTGFVGSERAKQIHLYRDTVYLLKTDFTREQGEIITIESGTLIKISTDRQPIGININPGGVLISDGTATDPVVFTTGDRTGTQGKNWRGILINGRSKNNSNFDRGDTTDFSGSLHFTRIEFGGLTLKEVGSESQLSDIQVSYSNSRAAFEIDGGTFDAKDLISYANAGGIDFFFTGGYRGRLQYLLAYRYPFFGGIADPFTQNTLCGVYVENSSIDPINASPPTFPRISNMTIAGPGYANGIPAPYFDSTLRTASIVTSASARFHFRNSVFLGYPSAGWYIDDYETALNMDSNNISSCRSSVMLDLTDTSKTFYLVPGAYPPFLKNDFRDYFKRSQDTNTVFANLDQFGFNAPLGYENDAFVLTGNSPLNGGANFQGSGFEDDFYDKVLFRGAFGTGNWAASWTNFKPLKTNYNFPQ
jgi:hypothetical protein